MDIFGFDLQAALTPDVSLFETFARGTVLYFSIYIMLRVVLRGRTSTTMTDLLVLVLIADAAQNGMTANYQSLTNGVVLVGTIIGWAFVLDWLGYRVPAVGGFVHPQRQPLVANGRLLRRNLARELITEEELKTQLRMQGVESLDQVKHAYLEGTGEISVIQRERK
jgi:uncharacterized membrane protein YcaP (DUF421 family)